MGIEARRERLPYLFDTSGMSRLECVSVTADVPASRILNRFSVTSARSSR